MSFDKPSFMLRMRVALMGLLHDYWKDTPMALPALFVMPRRTPKAAKPSSTTKKKHGGSAEAEEIILLDESGSPVVRPVREPQVWNADRVGVLEKMWGEGHSLPGGNAYLTALSSPLGITSDMSILDLGAGLGALARLLVDEYKTYVTGMEMDATLAARGMVMSIAAGKSKTASIVPYDPVNFTASRKFDCVFAREIFYKTIGKDKFFKAIDASIKTGGGQIVFTDYILDPASREKPAIVQWLNRENGAAPLSAIEMIKQWKAMGYDLRVADDQTDAYKAMIMAGLRNLVDFMVMNRPDIMTKSVVVREVDLWVRRVEAFGQGLKYYRFFGIRH